MRIRFFGSPRLYAGRSEKRADRTTILGLALLLLAALWGSPVRANVIPVNTTADVGSSAVRLTRCHYRGYYYCAGERVPCRRRRRHHHLQREFAGTGRHRRISSYKSSGSCKASCMWIAVAKRSGTTQLRTIPTSRSNEES
jgi:hypothetical protein